MAPIRSWSHKNEKMAQDCIERIFTTGTVFALSQMQLQAFTHYILFHRTIIYVQTGHIAIKWTYYGCRGV